MRIFLKLVKSQRSGHSIRTDRVQENKTNLFPPPPYIIENPPVLCFFLFWIMFSESNSGFPTEIFTTDFFFLPSVLPNRTVLFQNTQEEPLWILISHCSSWNWNKVLTARAHLEKDFHLSSSSPWSCFSLCSKYRRPPARGNPRKIKGDGLAKAFQTGKIFIF